MSQLERVATLCREHLAGRSLAHVFDTSIIKSYLRKHGCQGNAFSAAINSADEMIAQYRPSTTEAALIYEQFNP